MAAVAAKSARVLSDEFDLSTYFNSADVTREAAVPETTAFQASARSYLMGLVGGTASLAGFFDSVAGGEDVVLNAALGAASGQVVTVAPEGLAVGKRLDVLSSRLTRYQKSAPVDGVVGVSADIQADGGIDGGVALHDVTAETATANGTSVDNAASTANGGVGHLHVTANTRNGTLDVKIQHSTDNAVWADLITFAQIAASTVGKERKSVTGTVNRYTREVHTIAGTTGSVTPVVAFARKNA